MPLQQLDFITSNKNKLAEVNAILGDVVHLQSQSLDLTEIQGTIEEISKDKCRRAASIVGPRYHLHLYLTMLKIRRQADQYLQKIRVSASTHYKSCLVPICGYLT